MQFILNIYKKQKSCPLKNAFRPLNPKTLLQAWAQPFTNANVHIKNTGMKENNLNVCKYENASVSYASTRTMSSKQTT